MAELMIYRCNICGNIIMKLHDGGGPLVCCGQDMTLLKANTTDAATEKHVPVVECNGDEVIVKIGEVEHPMLEEHFIQFVCLQTEDGVLVEYLKPGQPPCVKFNLGGKKAVAAYEYCNLHGLWKKNL